MMNEQHFDSATAAPTDPELYAARRLAAYLDTPSVTTIYRLIQLFGVELIAAKAHDALALLDMGQPTLTYASARPSISTPLIAANGQRRDRHGVFLYLMQQHCTLIGVQWSGLLALLPPSSS